MQFAPPQSPRSRSLSNIDESLEIISRNLAATPQVALQALIEGSKILTAHLKSFGLDCLGGRISSLHYAAVNVMLRFPHSQEREASIEILRTLQNMTDNLNIKPRHYHDQ